MYISNGLPTYPLKDVIIDKEGVVWFCSERGITKFKDDNWTQYKNGLNSIGLNENTLELDKKGELWVGTIYGRLIHIKGEIWDTINVRGLYQSSFALIRDIEFDPTGTMWIAGGKNLYKYENKTFKTIPLDLIINTIAIAADGTIWIGTHGKGLFHYDGTSIINYTEIHGLSSNYISEITIDKDGTLWIGGASGVETFNGKKFTYIPYKCQKVDSSFWTKKIIIDQNNTKWLATLCGFFKYDGKVFSKLDHPYLQNDPVRSLALASNGVKWYIKDEAAYSFEDGGPGPVLLPEPIFGKVFEDLNENGLKDSGESDLPNRNILFDSIFISSNKNGLFWAFAEEGDHSFQIILDSNWTSTTPSVIKKTINNLNKIDTLYFGLKKNTSKEDVSISLKGSATRANFNSNYWIHYSNKGSSIQSGTIILELDKLASYITAFPAPSAINGNKFTWQFSNLRSWEERQITFQAKMPNVEALGNTMNSQIAITALLPESIISNNKDTLRQLITGSYDPNDKLVKPEGVSKEAYTLFNTSLTYTIRFQNTGTDTAFNITIRDTLSTYLEMSTIKILSYSHPTQLLLSGKNEAKFVFENVLLPDDKVNEPRSHGFVTFSISPKSILKEFTKITNQASIYFDFNPPIHTNQVFNTFVSRYPTPLAIPFFETKANTVSIVPNPIESSAKIFFPSEIEYLYTLVIFDQQGTEVMRLEKIKNGDIILNNRNLKPGLYLYNAWLPISTTVYKGKISVSK